MAALVASDSARTIRSTLVQDPTVSRTCSNPPPFRLCQEVGVSLYCAKPNPTFPLGSRGNQVPEPEA